MPSPHRFDSEQLCGGVSPLVNRDADQLGDLRARRIGCRLAGLIENSNRRGHVAGGRPAGGGEQIDAVALGPKDDIAHLGSRNGEIEPVPGMGRDGKRPFRDKPPRLAQLMFRPIDGENARRRCIRHIGEKFDDDRQRRDVMAAAIGHDMATRGEQ